MLDVLDESGALSPEAGSRFDWPEPQTRHSSWAEPGVLAHRIKLDVLLSEFQALGLDEELLSDVFYVRFGRRAGLRRRAPRTDSAGRGTQLRGRRWAPSSPRALEAKG